MAEIREASMTGLPWSEASPERSAATGDRSALVFDVMFRLVDALAILLATALAGALAGIAPAAFLFDPHSPLALAAPTFCLIAETRGLYREAVRQIQDLPVASIACAWLQACGILALLPLMLGISIAPPALTSAHGALVPPVLLAFLLAVPGILIGRAAWLGFAARTGRLPDQRLRVAIYGTGSEARDLAHILADDLDARIAVAGFVDPAGTGERRHLAGLPVLSLDDGFTDAVRPLDLDSILLPASQGEAVEQAARQLAPYPIAVKLVPDFALRGIPVQDLDTDGSVPMVQICAAPPRAQARVVKRALDLLLTPPILLFLAPLMLLVALAIKLDSPGPVLFRQPRRGVDGHIFNILKFRTMRHEAADTAGHDSVVRGDARITRIGALLRRTSIDELPQLLNVLRGDMSLVGPRPHALGSRAAGLTFEDAVAVYAARHRIRPGITGWAQVNGWRGETDSVEKLSRRVEHDLWYITHWSLGLDLMILLRTALATLSGRNAY